MGEIYVVRSSEYLAHHGIKGMKWGVRRFQEEDGSLTRAGKLRYGTADKGFGRELRTLQVQRVGRHQDKENARINKRLEKKAARSETKLTVAKAKGASDKKIAKLQTKADRDKLRAEYIKDRNERYKQIKLNYAKKSFTRRLLDIDTWYDTSYARASEATTNRMRNKYGDKRVDELEAHDSAIAIGASVAVSVAAVGIQMAAISYKNRNW